MSGADCEKNVMNIDELERKRKMGYIEKTTGFRLLGKTPPGTCSICAVAHDPGQPHNRDSLCYQYKFYDEHGRWPTWKDAMAHCSEEVKEYWIQALSEHGVIIEDE